MTATIYGIKNCDTMKKAFDWLKAHDVAYRFHDYRVDGIDAESVRGWCGKLGWETVLNKASTTFRELPAGAAHGQVNGRLLRGHQMRGTPKAERLDQPSVGEGGRDHSRAGVGFEP